MIPAGLGAFASPFFEPCHLMAAAAEGQFHFQPHYRNARPLDAILLQTQAGLDPFVNEKYVDGIAAILDEWISALLRSPQEMTAIDKVLAAEFSGCSMRPTQSRAVRGGRLHVDWLQINHLQFQNRSTLDRRSFLQEFKSSLGIFSKVLAAEFQITSIQTDSVGAEVPRRMKTRIRYEIVGTGRGFHREQRIGNWDLEWILLSENDFRLTNWQALEETRSRSLSPVFADVSAAALNENASYHQQILLGVDHWRTVLDGACGIDIYGHNGVSVGDVDGDGLDDLYVCQPAGLPNRLYRNQGDGTFEDITEKSGLGILENTTCALFADFRNSGQQDVIVVRANGPLLFVNEGGGKFRRKADAFRFANAPQGTFTGAAVADYDRDGWLDVYFCLYAYYQGTDQYKYPTPYHDAENGPPNFMMRNSHDGSFRDVTQESGLNQNNTRYSFCCGWGDSNGNGWPDLCVVNDFGRKNLYRNNGNGTFTDVAAQAGAEDVGAGMSVSWFDYDGDGAADLYLANMWTAAGERVSAQEIFRKESPENVRALYRKHAMGNSLLRNGSSRNGQIAFEDKTAAAGVGMGRWSWSSDAFDFDHDGFPDLYVTNGMISGRAGQDLNSFFWRQVVGKSPDIARSSPEYEQGWNAINELIRADRIWSGFERNVFYANNRDGTFSNVSGAVGLDFVEDGRAFALADFDGDGRQEIFLKNRNGPQLRVLKNMVDTLPQAIAFRLRGMKSNRDAIGAVITVETSGGRQARSLQAGSGFLAQHSKEVFFGLGDFEGAVQASVRWPNGLVQQFPDLPAGHRVWIEEGSEKLRSEPFKFPAELPGGGHATSQAKEAFPNAAESWLLETIRAPEFSLVATTGQRLSLGAVRGKQVLLNFWVTESPACLEELRNFERVHAKWARLGLELLAVNLDDPPDVSRLKALEHGSRLTFTLLCGSPDVAAVYNILYRYLFDRRRDLSLPTSFLIDERGDIVKVYRGPISTEQVGQDVRRIPKSAGERLAAALPFAGSAETFDHGRNNLSYGSNFFQRGYYEQAASFFELALRDDPSSAEACYGLGSAYLNLQKGLEARQSFERATKLRASYPDTLANAWNNLGLLAAREGHTEESIALFGRALQLNPDHAIALKNIGSAYRVLKRWDDAREAFEHALEVSPGDAESYYGLGMVFAQQDDTARAADNLQKALQARPDYPEALNNLGILYLRTRRRDEAVAKLQESIRVAPDFEPSYVTLAQVYALEGTPDKARAVLTELLKRHPEDAAAKNMLAQLPH